MKKTGLYALCMSVLWGGCTARLQAQAKVTNSQIIWGYVKKGNENRLAIRAFELDRTVYYLTIDPNTLTSQITLADKAAVESLKRSAAQIGDKDNQYQQLIQYTRQKPDMASLGLHWAKPNAGFPDIVWDVAHQNQAWRTDWIAKLLGLIKPNTPLRLAICVQGNKLLQHKLEIAWLQSQEKTGKVKLYWVNHGSGLWGRTKMGWATDALMSPDADIVAEVFDTEKQLLSMGLAPSVFYYVPGWVTDSQISQELIDFGLIPLGSDDAFAKAEQNKLGKLSFVSELGRVVESEALFIEHITQNPQYLRQHVWFVNSTD